jgi:hypothetical protein
LTFLFLFFIFYPPFFPPSPSLPSFFLSFLPSSLPLSFLFSPGNVPYPSPKCPLSAPRSYLDEGGRLQLPSVERRRLPQTHHTMAARPEERLGLASADILLLHHGCLPWTAWKEVSQILHPSKIVLNSRLGKTVS